jgi:hypothetical protein
MYSEYFRDQLPYSENKFGVALHTAASLRRGSKDENRSIAETAVQVGLIQTEVIPQPNIIAMLSPAGELADKDTHTLAYLEFV